MVRQGWLQPVKLPEGPGYRLTLKATRRLDEAAARIYRTERLGWDGRFDLIILTLPLDRTERSRLAANLSFLGYGALDATTWLAPRSAPEIDVSLTDAGVRYERFTAEHFAGAGGAAALVRRAWDLDELGRAYTDFITTQQPVVRLDADAGDEAAYAARFRIVHAWRTFLFRDPQLPPALLPERWPGVTAAAFFDRHAGRLRPAADRYVDTCLQETA
jgi:phenylacetic acid degradation operon negative regulatory protein